MKSRQDDRAPRGEDEEMATVAQLAQASGWSLTPGDRFAARPATRQVVHDPRSRFWGHRVLHELAHATAWRLGRRAPGDVVALTGVAYALEEVVAELAAAEQARRLGLPPDPGHAAYIADWARQAGPGSVDRARGPVAAILRLWGQV